MDSLPYELFEVVLNSMGGTTAAFAEACIAKRVCKKARAVSIRLPRDEDASDVAFIDLSQLATYTYLRKTRYMQAIDAQTDKIVTIGASPRQLRHDFSDKPCAASWLYLPDKRIVWCPPSSLVRLTLPYAPKDKLLPIVNKPLFAWPKYDAEMQTLASAPYQTVPQKRSRTGFCPAYQDALDEVKRQIETTMNSDVRGLVLHVDKDENAPIKVADLAKFQNIQRLTLSRVSLKLNDLIRLVDTASHLVYFELYCLNLPWLNSYTQSAYEQLFISFTTLLLRWKEHDNVHGLCLVDDRGQALKGHHHMALLHAALSDIASATDGTLEVIDHDDETVAVLDSNDHARVFVSYRGITKIPWSQICMGTLSTLLERAKDAAYPAAEAEEDEAVVEQSVTQNAPVVPEKRSHATMAFARRIWTSDYSNPVRERDRYMIQWYDAICSGCGAQWPKDTVTISAFQTYTSMCLKGKKPCTSRPQFQRVSNGEKFVVDDHMPGNGGTDLTPPCEQIKAAAKRGLLTAIDPTTREYVYFRQCADNPRSKIPVTMSVEGQE